MSGAPKAGLKSGDSSGQLARPFGSAAPAFAVVGRKAGLKAVEAE